ncbi:MAG: flagellar protein FlgN [Fibrobacteria bacterium]
MGAEFRQQILREDFADIFEDVAPTPAPAVLTAVGPLCETLIANLAAQQELYAAYLHLANRQRIALINRNIAENQDVNGETDVLVTALAELEAERATVTAGILGPRLAGSAATPAKCETIFPLVSVDQAARLKDCRDSLMASVAELKRALAINSALVENGSRIVRATIGIMTSVAGRSKVDKMNTYTAKGNVNVGKLQLRNLVNRSV